MRTYPATGIREDLGPTRQGVLIRRMILAAAALFVSSAALVSSFEQAHAGSPPSGVQIALTPSGQTFAPGSDFYLDVMVTQPSQPYNTWQGTIAYNPSALTYLPAGTAEQGCLMTGGCSNACGNTFLRVTPGPDSVYILNSVQCYQTFISDPGQLYHLHFRASSVAQQTSVSFKALRFNDGIQYASPVIYAPAQIGIGMPATAVDPSASVTGLHVSATPNPSRGAVTFALGSENSGEQEVAVHDISGRLVRVVSRSWQAAGTRQLFWDGMDDSGSRAAPGVYLVMLRVGNHRTQGRVTLLD